MDDQPTRLLTEETLYPAINVDAHSTRLLTDDTPTCYLRTTFYPAINANDTLSRRLAEETLPGD